MLSPYSMCPCGSGKKFKWCCEPIYPGIQKALDQEASDQHQAAFNTLQDVVKKHPRNPEAWGQLARMYYGQGKTDDAEASLQKAFDINPDYPYGLLLRGMFRYQEGERPGALILLRRAVEAYGPDASDFLAEAYAIIYECETQMRRPLAARAALQLACRYRPDEPALREELDTVFSPQGTFPESACKLYALVSPSETVGKDRRAVWDEAINTAKGAKLGELVKLFEKITTEDDKDWAAWFNLGLAKAWVGDNSGAIEAFDRYLDGDDEGERATTAATLMEVLRFGAGLQEQSDYSLHRFTFQIREPEKVSKLIEEWLSTNQLLLRQSEEQGVLYGMFLEQNRSGLVTAGATTSGTSLMAGYFTVIEPMVSISSPFKATIERLQEEVRSKLGLTLADATINLTPASYSDTLFEAYLFPTNREVGLTPGLVQEHMQTYFEEKWLHQPRKALSGNTPLDAVGHPKLRKKLLGVLSLIEETAKNSPVEGYDFDRLRRKLRLIEGSASTGEETGDALDISEMNASELANLPADNLAADQLEQAWKCAVKLDARELGANFAQRLAELPDDSDRPDRYTWFSYLIQHAVLNNNLDEALNHVNEGERIDCEQNEGKRRNEYELRRGQIHTKRGEGDQASEVFERLLDRTPDNVQYYAHATEAMLAVKKGPKAVGFAEKGLEQARKQNDRDSEGHLMELLEAANRLS